MRGLSVDHAALGLVSVEPFTDVSLESTLFLVIPDSGSSTVLSRLFVSHCSY